MQVVLASFVIMFTRSLYLTDKVLHMLNEAASLEFVVTDNEVEALVLESNLIKRLRPPYNIKLRDDKQYPLLKVTVQEP